MNKLSTKAGKKFVREFVDFYEGCWVLDIGCGPANILKSVSFEINYTGIDLNPEYITTATKNFGEIGNFYLMNVEDLSSKSNEKYDRILILGTLHHLSNEQIEGLLRVTSTLLNENGVLVTHDPIRSSKQNVISRILMDLDRGKHIRQISEHISLFEKYFEISYCVRDDIMKFPYQIMYVRGTRKSN
jgi:2-polyprenyl-3-methyl-5-hydroxy-6-metoxy-1,4-benzoquinol methylase